MPLLSKRRICESTSSLVWMGGKFKTLLSPDFPQSLLFDAFRRSLE
ncbi:hypothetical protein RMSM_05099 [Rhodopirellula maiorica SM1]|uniref:Uncharacterized protein n=1 Tax=Rhodopirellula maiorica SM1 TaxID=1265738 RepID=M5RRG0_9BACT|nr:hypothetical protein RMSM_05099 [Rhodopirellula maiorica SM1]